MNITNNNSRFKKTNIQDLSSPIAVTGVNNTRAVITRKCKLHLTLQARDGDQHTVQIDDVLLSDCAPTTIISPAQLTKQTTITAHISKDSNSITIGNHTYDLLVMNDVYYLPTIEPEGKRRDTFPIYALTGDGRQAPRNTYSPLPTQEQTWHSRMGHACPATIRAIMSSRGLSPANKRLEELRHCGTCAVINIKKGTTQKSSARSITRVLQLICMDLVGPMMTARGSVRYYIIIVDYYSSFTWVYTIRYKGQLKKLFEKWIAEIKITARKKIGSLAVSTLRTDNELCITTIQTLCSNNGIEYEASPSYEHEYNGKVERQVQTINHITLSLLHHAELNAIFWPAAVTHAAWISNRRPLMQLQGLTPHAMITENKDYVDRALTFGCLVYVIKQTNKEKLDPAGEPGMYLGFHTNTKSHAIFLPQSESFVSRRTIRTSEHINATARFPQYSHTNILSLNTPNTIAMADTLNRVRQKLEDNILTHQFDLPPHTSNDDDLDILPTDAEATAAEPPSEPQQHSAPQAIVTEETTTTSPPTPTINDSNGDTTTSTPEHDQHGVEHIALAAYLTHERQTAPINMSVSTALKGNHAAEYIDAMKSEVDSLWERGVFTEVAEKDAPRTAVKLSSQLILTEKKDMTGKHVKYKARLIAHGNKDPAPADLTHYAPVAAGKSVRLLLALAAHEDWPVWQLDIKTAFLYAPLKREIYIYPPNGYRKVRDMRSHTLLRLHKALYGLRESPQSWNTTFISYLVNKLKLKVAYGADSCMLYNKDKTLVIVVYVDDVLYTAKSVDVLQWFKQQVKDEYDIKDLMQAESCLGIHIRRVRGGGYYIDQEAFTNQLITKYAPDGHPKATPVPQSVKITPAACPKPDSNEKQEMKTQPYREIVGSLLWLAMNTRPDIAATVSKLSKVLHNPGRTHWDNAIHVVKYLKATKTLGLHYKIRQGNVPFSRTIHGYTDADFAGGDTTTKYKSTSGWVFMVSGTPVSWASKRQTIIAQSSMESEYYAASLAAKEAMHLDKLLYHMAPEIPSTSTTPTLNTKCPLISTITIYIDNTPAMANLMTSTINKANKHFELKMYLVREYVKKGIIKFQHKESKANLADIFTKIATKAMIAYFVQQAMVDTEKSNKQ